MNAPRPISAALWARAPMRNSSATSEQVLEDSPFHGEGYRKVWARLRFAGIRTSKERVRRLMREAGLQAPHRVGKPRGPKAHNGTIRTERPDRMWGTHMTTTVTTEFHAAWVVWTTMPERKATKASLVCLAAVLPMTSPVFVFRAAYSESVPCR